jgi:hypothetical protein
MLSLCDLLLDDVHGIQQQAPRTALLPFLSHYAHQLLQQLPVGCRQLLLL